MANPSDPDVQITAPGFVERVWHDVRVSAAFLTRVPVPLPADATLQGPVESEDAVAATAETEPDTERASAIGRASGMFPIVGAAVGAAAAIPMVLTDRIGVHPLACALIAIGVQAMISGAMHEDGLADFADGLYGGHDPATRLAIMRDSRIGTCGALALILSVALKATLLSQLSAIEIAVAALIGAAAVSRGALPAVMRYAQPARRDGLLVSIGRADARAVTTAIALSVIIALIAHGLGLGIVICAVTAGGAVIVTFIATRALGGVTGDVLGAVQQTAELLVLAAVAIGE